MFNKYDLAVVIPVRLGSSRVSRKALLEVGPDKISLLAWKIRQLKKILPRESIYVSTEAPELKEIALEEGVMVHERDAYLADGHKASFSEVIVGVVKDIPHEHIAWVTCVVPLMSPQEYLQGFQEYYDHVIPETSSYNSLVSVNLLKEYFWDDEKPINYSATKNHTISQDLPNIYRVTNGLYMAPKALMLREEYLLGDNPYKSCVSKIAGIDIDEYEDYEIARSLTDLYSANVKKQQQDTHVFLDFDGVIVDSALEAYAIAMITTERMTSLAGLDASSEHFKRFLTQRCHIGPAWNYYYLLNCLDEGLDSEFASILPNEAGFEAKRFQEQFFATRTVIRNTMREQWLVLNRLYEGSERFIELINNNSNISILTSKDQASVKELLDKYGLKRDIDIYDTKEYDEYGCKSFFIDAYIKENDIKKALFVDDLDAHIKKSAWVNNLSVIQATWGYVQPNAYHDNKLEVLNKISEFLR